MLISFLVLTFNQEKYIINTLDSIKQQSISVIDYEIIICDDASTDKTIPCLEGWIADNPQVRCILSRQAQNSGTVKNLLSGIKFAKGKYIKILAADDWLITNRISIAIEYMQKKNLSILCCNFIAYNEANNQYIPNIMSDNYKYFFSANTKKQLKLLTVNNYVYAPAILLTNQLLHLIISSVKGYKFLEDYPLWFEVARQNIPITFLNTCIVNYRQNENNITNFLIFKPHHLSYFDDLCRFKKYCLRHFFWDCLSENLLEILIEINTLQYKSLQIGRRKYAIINYILCSSRYIYLVYIRYFNFIKKLVKGPNENPSS